MQQSFDLQKDSEFLMMRGDLLNDDMENEPKLAVHRFGDDGAIPNNPTLPLLIYEGVLDLAGSDPNATCDPDTACDVAATCIKRFADHGWHGA